MPGTISALLLGCFPTFHPQGLLQATLRSRPPFLLEIFIIGPGYGLMPLSATEYKFGKPPSGIGFSDRNKNNHQEVLGHRPEMLKMSLLRPILGRFCAITGSPALCGEAKSVKTTVHSEGIRILRSRRFRRRDVLSTFCRVFSSKMCIGIDVFPCFIE